MGFDKKPVPGNVLIWVDSGFFKYTGHIGIVTEVVDRRRRTGQPSEQEKENSSSDDDDQQKEEKYPYGVRIWEQNFDDSSWNGRDYSRELPAKIDEETGKLEIIEPIYGSIVKGWMATRCMLKHEQDLLLKKEKKRQE